MCFVQIKYLNLKLGDQLLINGKEDKKKALSQDGPGEISARSENIII